MTVTGIFRPQNALSDIPTGSLMRQCAGKCTTQHNPDMPLKLLLIPNNGDISISWNCPIIYNSNDMIISNNDLRLIIKNDAFNGGETIDCTAMMTQLSDNDISGEARISINVNSKPYCKNTNACTVIEIKSDTIEFGDAQFQVTALDVTDDDMSSLNYQFGCISQNDIKRTYQKSTQAFFTFSGLNVGNNTCYVCAIDSFDSEYCEYFTLEVTEPGAITDDQKAASLIQIENSFASGDPVAVTSSSRQLSYLLQYSLLINNTTSTQSNYNTTTNVINVINGRRKLTQVTSSDMEYAYQTISYQSSLILNNDLFDKSLYLSTIEVFDLLLDFIDEEGLDLMLNVILSGLDLYQDSSVSFTATEADTLATDLTKITSYYLPFEIVQIIYNQFSITMTDVYWDSLKNAILTLLCENLVSLDPLNMAMYSDGMTPNLAFGCQKLLLNSLSGANITLGDAEVSIMMPEDYAMTCGTDCPNEQEWHLWYLGDVIDILSNYTNFKMTSNIFGFNASSNIHPNNTICENGQCSVFIEIPVTYFGSEKSTACFNLEGNLVSHIEYYNPDKNSVICEIWSFGEYFVADYGTIPVLTISSSSDNVILVNYTYSPEIQVIDDDEVQFDISSMKVRILNIIKN